MKQVDDSICLFERLIYLIRLFNICLSLILGSHQIILEKFHVFTEVLFDKSDKDERGLLKNKLSWFTLIFLKILESSGFESS